MGNTLAHLMLFAWPLVVVVLFRALPVPKAIAVSLVAGYLILPTQPVFGLPLLPPYGKTMAIVLPTFAMALLASRPPPGPRAVPAFQGRPGWLPQSMLLRVCFFAIILGTTLTVLTNGDPLVYPLRTIRAMQPHEAASVTVAALVMVLPFLLARKFLARPEDQAMLLAILCVATLAYSLPTLWEIRMSPRLNVQVYGFFPHDWIQHLRAGGFRPLVFLEHGLRLGLFLAIGILAAAATFRFAPGRYRGLVGLALVWLLATLVLSKNLTAFLIVALLLPVILLLRPRTQLVVAAVLAGTVLVYPMMRAGGLVPVQAVSSAIGTFAERGRLASLGARFANEDILLDKANERPLFGWGGSGRARVFDEQGRDISTPDGRWILDFGEYGWVGYLGRFGLLAGPILILAFRRRDPVSLGTSGLAVVVAGNLLDLVPNSGLTPLTWVMAGSLAGRLETRTAEHDATEAEAAATAPARTGSLPYRRFPPAAPPPPAAGAAAEQRSPVTGVRMRPQPARPREST